MKSMSIKDEEEIAIMTEAGRRLAKVLRDLEKEIKEGMTTKDIDTLAEEIIRGYGCVPNFLNYNGFPASVCVSLNNEVVHGIPSNRRTIKNGDIVSIDTGVFYEGLHTDAARTYGVGDISDEAKKLIEVTEESFYKGICYAKPGCHLVDIARGIQTHAQKNHFSVVRDLTGHGIGRELHEEPVIPNYVRRRRGVRLLPGMTLCIEPMINAGNYSVAWLDDDWTVVTQDDSLSAHYENTVLITEDGCDILTVLTDENQTKDL